MSDNNRIHLRFNAPAGVVDVTLTNGQAKDKDYLTQLINVAFFKDMNVHPYQFDRCSGMLNFWDFTLHQPNVTYFYTMYLSKMVDLLSELLEQLNAESATLTSTRFGFTYPRLVGFPTMCVLDVEFKLI